ncbi:histidinol-phosphate transaminase [Bacillus sp. 03113]|uniref:histidinol-phosphate transaminase n=1 Tax=Bacillus sp. 03113 TaxID=2578211 RepID=UPI0011426E0C|nr:histidinol-phosphate transaminase [Bacillus sp. 03113]
MSQYWNQLVKKLEPYVPGEQPKDKSYVKLNTNENPYPPSPYVLEAITQAVNDQLRLYPDPNCDQLRETIAKHFKLSSNQVFVGNGSDEVLGFSFMSFFSPDRPVLFADITYSFYKVYANLCDLNVNLIPLDDDFSLPMTPFCEPNGGVVIPNPNAPTGQLLPLTSIKTILDANPDSVVIVDEAYVDFGGESAVPLIHDYPNLLVVQTLSKYSSLAGIRVGFALGHPELIDGLNRLKNSFNSYTIDRLALAGAVAAIEDNQYFQETAQKIMATREHTTAQLKELGFSIVPSKANFIFITHPEVEAEFLFHQLKTMGILVRYFNKPRISNYLRVTIGTDEEMEQFLSGVKTILQRT